MNALQIDWDYLLSITDGGSGCFPSTADMCKPLLTVIMLIIYNSGRGYHSTQNLSLEFTSYTILTYPNSLNHPSYPGLAIQCNWDLYI